MKLSRFRAPSASTSRWLRRNCSTSLSTQHQSMAAPELDWLADAELPEENRDHDENCRAKPRLF